MTTNKPKYIQGEVKNTFIVTKKCLTDPNNILSYKNYFVLFYLPHRNQIRLKTTYHTSTILYYTNSNSKEMFLLKHIVLCFISKTAT